MDPRLARFPAYIDTGHAGVPVLARQEDRCAVLDPPHGAHPLLKLDDGNIAVFADVPPDVPSPRLVAVYADASGAVAVPTGRVFVRFLEAMHAEDERARLRDAGFVVVDIPPYAPHCAWLEATDRDPVTALVGIATLRVLPGVVHVEPELIRVRRNR
jgi:hypothetical protein